MTTKKTENNNKQNDDAQESAVKATDGKKNIVKKVSFKSVCKKAPTTVVELTDPDNPTGEKIKKSVVIDQDLMRVAGIITETKEKSTDYGVSTCFIGTIRGLNLLTGETFDGGELYLPETAQIFLNNHIKGLGENFVSIQFAFDIGVKANLKSTVGYEFTVKPLVEDVAKNDPLANLFSLLPPTPVAKLLENQAA